jgi:stage II sporulation protein AA (anti-sigma F factor antagonist)
MLVADFLFKGSVKMSVKITASGEVVTAFLDGEIDHHSASVIRNEIDAEVERQMPTMLILDFRDVTFMDSSGIGLVMGRYKLLKPMGAELHITNTSPQIFKVMKLAGLDRLAKLDR